MPSGVWCATLSAAQAAASTFNALQVESHAGATTWERATLARFPNANPELGASTTRWRSRGLFLYPRRARALGGAAPPAPPPRPAPRRAPPPPPPPPPPPGPRPPSLRFERVASPPPSTY
jgi:hypothetical protein